MSNRSEILLYAERNTSNYTEMDSDQTGSLQGMPYDNPVRVALLSAVCIVSLIGNSLVCLWMCRFWKRCPHKSPNIQRVNYFILNLTIADLCVTLFTIPTQIGLDCIRHVWYAGTGLCKVLKFLHTFSLTSSSYMVAAIAIDRYWTICKPLRNPSKSRYIIVAAWLMSLVPSLPLLFLFQVLYTDDTPHCGIVFVHGNSTETQEANRIYSRWYTTGVTVSVFLLPFFVIVFAYTRMLITIWTKAGCGQAMCNDTLFVDVDEEHKHHETSLQHHFRSFSRSSASRHPSTTSQHGNRRSSPNSRVHTKNATLPKAKKKTLRMTIAIVVTFILSCLPYFVLMIVESFGSDDIREKFQKQTVLVSIMSITVASNSAVNPYIFLLFNLDRRYACIMFSCCNCKTEPPKPVLQLPPPVQHRFYRSPPRNGPMWKQVRDGRDRCLSDPAIYGAVVMAKQTGVSLEMMQSRKPRHV